MALNDLGNQNIQDTYQKVVQTEGNLFADGSGSALHIITADQTSSMSVATASYAVSASHEITYELSSSHAVNADTASFATNFTASGNISASGQIYSNQYYYLSNKVILTDYGSYGGIDQAVGNPLYKTTLIGQTIEFGNASNIRHATASGNISASGTGSFEHIQLPGGGTIQFDDTVGSNDQWIIGNDNNITVDGDAKVKLIANDTIEVGIATNDIKLTIDTSEGHITASGNISASGNVITSKTGLPYESAIVYHAGGININVDDGESPAVKIGADFGQVAIGQDIDFPSNQMLTVGGTISSSGHIQTQAGVYAEHLESSDDIVALGNISASGEIIGTINGGTF